MGPTYVTKGTMATVTGATISVGYIPAVPAGDWLYVAVLSYQEPGGSIGDIVADEPGWTEVAGGVGFRDSSLNNVGTFKVFRKIADGTETGSADFTRSGSNGGSNAFVGQMYQYTGVNIQQISAASNILGDGDGTISWGNVGVVGGETTAIAFVGQMTNNPGTPGGYVNNASDSSGGIVIYLEVSTDENSAGGSKTAGGGDSDGWATVHTTIFCPSGFVVIADH